MTYNAFKMDDNSQKERFSEAFVQAIAAAAGFGVGAVKDDRDSIDIAIRGHKENDYQRSPCLDVQLKCTSKSNHTDDEGYLSFSLKIKNYNDLRADSTYPRILIVVFVPDDVSEWLEESAESLLLRHNAFWVRLQGLPESKNASSTTIKIPSHQRFTTDALTHIMKCINDREEGWQ